MRTIVSLCVVLLSCCGCSLFESDVPPDVILAHEASAQIIEDQAANERDLILAYEADLDAAYTQHENERLERELASGKHDTPDKVKALVIALDQNRVRRRADAERRKAAFFATIASNCTSAKALSEATRRYIDDISDQRKALAPILEHFKPKPADQPKPIAPLVQPEPPRGNVITGAVL